MSALDAAFMERALFLAERGLGRTTPNPVVGAVVVSPSGVVVGQGAHLRAGGPHAEVVALEAAGDRARGATLYCTLEPCSHTGRTGPCVERVVEAGITRVVAATRDPNPSVSGAGFAVLRQRGIDVVEGVAGDTAARLNAPFFRWVQHHRAFVQLKAAISRDGFVGPRGAAMRLTGAAADRYLQRQRAAIDAIAVGSETVIVDDPLLTARGAYRARPLTRVLFDWRARISPQARVFSTLSAGPVIIVVSSDAAAGQSEALAALRARGAVVQPFANYDLQAAVEWLGARDIVSLLVEGGPRLQAAFVDAGLVDRVQWVVTPSVLAEGVPLWTPTERLRWSGPPRVRTLGADTLIEVDVHRTD